MKKTAYLMIIVNFIAVSLVVFHVYQKGNMLLKANEELLSQVNNANDALKKLKNSSEVHSVIIKYLLETHDSNNKNEKWCLISSAGNGFGVLPTQYGNMLLMIHDIKEYADGFRVTIGLGNIYSAGFANCLISIRYGAPPSEGQTREDWISKSKLKDISISRELVSGAWNYFDVVLAPANKDDVGFFEVKMDIKSVSLNDIKKQK